MARFIAQLIVSGGQVVARAFARALREEMQSNVAARAAAAESGRDGQKTVKANTFTGMSLEEALQILHVKDLEDSDMVQKKYDHLFKLNDKASGGSFYLQSKINFPVSLSLDVSVHLGQPHSSLSLYSMASLLMEVVYVASSPALQQGQVYRAKERVDLEMENMHRKEEERKNNDQT